jgi:hypothetical protein
MEFDKFDRRIRIFSIIVSIAMPIAVGFAGYFIQLRISQHQINQSVVKELSSKLADRRLAIYDQIKHPLNDIYCYIEEVGDWDAIYATDLRKIRHKLNNIMYSNRALWSPETFQVYLIYIDATAFSIDRVNGYTRVRANYSLDLRPHENANTANKFITGERDVHHKEVYHRLNDLIATDLQLKAITL